jgi:phage anti-repressor protein
MYEYLIKHIDFDIDKEFVKQFYQIQKNKSEFNVDVDVVADWLEAKTENLVDTLKYSYKENEDYIVKLDVKPKNKNHGGSKKKSYFISSECFKMLALNSNSKNGKKIRKYYIKLESIIDHYKDEIVELYKNEQEIKKLNKKIYPKKPGIYIIREIRITANNKKRIRYKFGSTGNLRYRMNVYNTGVSDKVDLIFFEEQLNFKVLESCVKDGLKEFAYKEGKEFFTCSLRKIKKMIKSCIDVYDNKLFRPSTSNILAIQFTFVKNNFDTDKMIDIEFDDYDSSKNEESSNEYNDHWIADDVNPFKEIRIDFENNSNISNDDTLVGGKYTENETLYEKVYEENKKAYTDLMHLIDQLDTNNSRVRNIHKLT